MSSILLKSVTVSSNKVCTWINIPKGLLGVTAVTCYHSLLVLKYILNGGCSCSFEIYQRIFALNISHICSSLMSYIWSRKTLKPTHKWTKYAFSLGHIRLTLAVPQQGCERQKDLMTDKDKDAKMLLQRNYFMMIRFLLDAF